MQVNMRGAGQQVRCAHWPSMHVHEYFSHGDVILQQLQLKVPDCR